jgi:hypothetical protein
MMEPLTFVFAFLSVIAGLKAIEHHPDHPNSIYLFWTVAVYVLAAVTCVLVLV